MQRERVAFGFLVDMQLAELGEAAEDAGVVGRAEVDAVVLLGGGGGEGECEDDRHRRRRRAGGLERALAEDQADRIVRVGRRLDGEGVGCFVEGQDGELVAVLVIAQAELE